jgi:hypothetical protein
VRRLHLPRLHHREVPARGHPAGARPWPRQGRQDDGGLRDRRALLRRHRQHRGRDGRGRRHPQQIAFYGSTPAYRGVLDVHGWGGLQDELNTLSKQGKWVEMGNLIDDEILNTFAVVGEPESVAPELTAATATSSSGSASTPRTRATPSAGPASSRPSRPPDQSGDRIERRVRSQNIRSIGLAA